ncbi:MAG: hypothetical protein H8E36_00745 [Rhodospirillaceae bacterium]|nr:hypothetical protein [Rhodospirillaceae bacterium]MBL6941459.1 hypothetical protein [Rhodospirillales bacterium]
MAAPPGETTNALIGIFRLARLDPTGIEFFRNTPGAFWRSFKVALIIAPFYAGLLSMRYAMGEVSTPPLRFIAVETIAYTIAWLAFPVIVEPISRAMGRSDKYIRFIIAYNWASLLQNMLYLPLAMLSVTAVLPPDSGGGFGLIVLLVIMGFTWFIARTALEISAGRAAGLVVIDFTISLLINGYAEKML